MRQTQQRTGFFADGGGDTPVRSGNGLKSRQAGQTGVVKAVQLPANGPLPAQTATERHEA
jgi:hypothetical protein